MRRALPARSICTRRGALAAFALALASGAVAGCDYGRLAAGQIEVLRRRQPLEQAVQDPELSTDERALLGLVESVRAFAAGLGLRVGDQYTSFVSWPGDRIVTTLVRTRPGSLDAVGWWYPFLGRLPYRGYFDRERAEREAERLRTEHGFDVCVSPVTAYSTLGWLDDPVTSPMLGRGAANLVETLLHELVHATVFVAGDADFNEGAALFIGQEAAVRYFAARAAEGAAAPALPNGERVRAWVGDRRRVEAAVLAFRERLPALAARPDGPAQRAAAERVLRGELATLPLAVLDPAAVAAEVRLGDACLALRGTYSRDLPRHAALLEALGGRLDALIARLVRLGKDGGSSEGFFALAGAPASAAAARPRR